MVPRVGAVRQHRKETGAGGGSRFVGRHFRMPHLVVFCGGAPPGCRQPTLWRRGASAARLSLGLGLCLCSPEARGTHGTHAGGPGCGLAFTHRSATRSVEAGLGGWGQNRRFGPPGGPKLTEIGRLGAPKLTKIDRFGAPKSTKMGPTRWSRFDQNRGSRRPKNGV